MGKIKIRRIVAAYLAAFLLILPTSVSAAEAGTKKVYLGGAPFGICFSGGALRVCGFTDIETGTESECPAKASGVCEGDYILTVNEKEVKSPLDVTLAVKESGGESLTLGLLRGEGELEIKVAPALSKETGDWRLGIMLENGSCGLGTVTYIDRKTGEFGGLGHGILEGDSGELRSFSRGVVSEVEIESVKRGEKGEPGELRGEFLQKKLGVVTKNTDKGVFGVLTEMPGDFEKKSVPLGSADEVKNGGASVFCTVDSGEVCEYAVEISLIDGGEGEAKNFLITVCDTSLIEKTGGIVRGMSGSPVVQNGKLIGAVTHVLVSDPTKGYGIFIEKMMDAANSVTEDNKQKEAS